MCIRDSLWQQFHSLCVPDWSLPLGIPHCGCSCQCTQATIVRTMSVLALFEWCMLYIAFLPVHFSAMRCSPISAFFCCANACLSCGDNLIRLWLILMLYGCDPSSRCQLSFMLSWSNVYAVCLEAGPHRCACAASYLFGLQSLVLDLGCGHPSSTWSKMYPLTASLLSVINALALSRPTRSMARNV